MNDPGASLDFGGRVALVTGAAGAIGAAIATSLEGCGARVFTVDLPGQSAGGESLPADLSDPAAAAAIVATVKQRAGRLDFLIHAAGITRDSVLWKMDDAAWRAVMSVNLDAAFYLLRAATPLLREGGGGSVVLIASINGERGKFGQANYAASKAGLIALGKTAALELGRFGIRVNAIAPGWIETAMTAGLPEEYRQRAIQETPLGRLGAPGDVAGAALFLCSDLARHVTGQVLRVDGGQLTA